MSCITKSAAVFSIFLLSSCQVQPYKKINELRVSHEIFKDDSVIDLHLSKSSYQSLINQFIKEDKAKIRSKEVLKSYYFDYPFNKGLQGLLLRTNGLVLRIIAGRESAQVRLKVNRMLKEPKNSSIYNRFEYLCELGKSDTVEQILVGKKPILSLSNKECSSPESLEHPITVAKRILKSEVLGSRGLPQKVSLASVIPVAATQETIYKFMVDIFGETIDLQLEKTIYPKGITGYSFYSWLPKERRSNKFHMTYSFLENNRLSYSRNFYNKEDLTFLISESSHSEYKGLIKSGFLVKSSRTEEL